MPISSIVVECQHKQINSVSHRVRNLAHTEIVQATDDFLVVVTDTDSREQDRDLIHSLAVQPGVISAIPVFTNCEDLTEGMGIALQLPEAHAPMEV